MRAYERLIQYAQIHTASSEEGPYQVPSTARQFDLAHLLVKELKELGVEDAHVDEHCYVYASLPATQGCEKAPKIGFISHMDTVPDFPGENVKPTLVENYDGGDIPLGNSGRVLSPKDFPSLKRMVGRTLITTDGTTVLGADDKAGVAEIMTMIETIQQEHLPHGALGFAFTPDEEIGQGTDFFDVPGFGCDYAYTLDGGEEGEIEFENFNAASAAFEVKGFNVHPGSAKNTMINAMLVAMEINAMLPAAEIPARTEGYEGFFHIVGMEGTVEKAVLKYIVRDHDLNRLAGRKQTMELIEKTINEKYGDGTCILHWRDGYRNMSEKIRAHFHLIDNAVKACEMAGVKPNINPIRGGTDGASLSFMGLPCPNLGVGGFGYHGPYEHISIEGMDKAVQVGLNLVELYRVVNSEK